MFGLPIVPTLCMTSYDRERSNIIRGVLLYSLGQIQVIQKYGEGNIVCFKMRKLISEGFLEFVSAM